MMRYSKTKCFFLNLRLKFIFDFRSFLVPIIVFRVLIIDVQGILDFIGPEYVDSRDFFFIFDITLENEINTVTGGRAHDFIVDRGERFIYLFDKTSKNDMLLYDKFLKKKAELISPLMKK